MYHRKRQCQVTSNRYVPRRDFPDGRRKLHPKDLGPEPETVSLTLSWSTPGERVSGDKLYLYELDGYTIRYKQVGDSNYQSVTISDGEATEYQVGNLAPGTYEFMIAVFDINGVYSDYTPAQTVDLN